MFLGRIKAGGGGKDPSTLTPPRKFLSRHFLCRMCKILQLFQSWKRIALRQESPTNPIEKDETLFQSGEREWRLASAYVFLPFLHTKGVFGEPHACCQHCRKSLVIRAEEVYFWPQSLYV